MKQNEIIKSVINNLVQDKELYELELYRLHEKSDLFDSHDLINKIIITLDSISDINQKILTYQNFFDKPQED
jgi:hypothetical protein